MPLSNSAHPPRVLTIAGSDSGSGAGIQADLRTVQALGSYGCAAITVVTAQNTVAVEGMYALPPAIVAAQMRAVLDDIGADALKTGMLGTPEIVETIATTLRAYPARPLVVDTVLRASTGANLTPNASPQALAAAMVRHLFPLASLVTPNLDEAAVLLGMPLGSLTQRADLPRTAQALLALGCRAVLLKGGHLHDFAAHDDTLVDYYLDVDGTERWFEHARSASKNLHGTGCTLSAAITTGLAQGLPMLAAIAQGIDYTAQAIAAGQHWRIGQGIGPLGVPKR